MLEIEGRRRDGAKHSNLLSCWPSAVGNPDHLLEQGVRGSLVFLFPLTFFHDSCCPGLIKMSLFDAMLLKRKINLDIEKHAYNTS